MSWQATIHDVNPDTDRDAWLEKRRGGIGASDVAGIMGLSPWATPFTVWAEKKMGYRQAASEAMGWGRRLEDVICDEFTEREGLFVGDRQLLVSSVKYPWAMATLDGVVYESPPSFEPTAFCPEHHRQAVPGGTGRDAYFCIEPGHDTPLRSEEIVRHDVTDRRLDALGLAEVKTDAQWGRWNEVPDHYQIQCQWQMFVTSTDHVWLVCLHGGRQLEVYEIAADSTVQGLLWAKAQDFYDKYVVGDDQPDPDESKYTTKILSDLWKGEGAEVELPRTVQAVWEALPSLKAELKRLEGEVKKRENQVKAALGDNTIGTVGGEPVVTWKRQERKGHYVSAAEFRVLRSVGKRVTK